LTGITGTTIPGAREDISETQQIKCFVAAHNNRKGERAYQFFATVLHPGEHTHQKSNKREGEKRRIKKITLHSLSGTGAFTKWSTFQRKTHPDRKPRLTRVRTSDCLL